MIHPPVPENAGAEESDKPVSGGLTGGAAPGADRGETATAGGGNTG